MAAAEQSRDRLALSLELDPGVSLIDIGSENGQLILRVHLRTESARLATPVPDQVNGIPVRTLVADYRIQQG